MNHTSLDTRKDWQNMYKYVKSIVYTCICHQIFSHMWIHLNSFFQAPLRSCWWNNPSRPGENLTFRKSGWSWSGWASQVKLSQKVWNSVGIKKFVSANEDESPRPWRIPRKHDRSPQWWTLDIHWRLVGEQPVLKNAPQQSPPSHCPQRGISCALGGKCHIWHEKSYVSQ